MSVPLVEIRNLKKHFATAKGTLHAVDDISFKIEKGKTLGVVGESGCGKSTLGRTIIHLLESTDGTILFNGEDVTRVDRKKLKYINENMQIVFQDPYSSLNPRQTVEEIVREPLRISGRYKSRRELDERTEQLMDMVGIDRRLRLAYPHELDGGRRQRVGIARALALEPQFIVCDEPVSALDVSIQAQVLNLLQDLQEQQGLTYMFVTHDLSVVRHISDDICVMYLGQVMEMTSSRELFNQPLHPYTKALLSSIPSTNIHGKRERLRMQGEITSPIDPKPSCRFMTRCPYAGEQCTQPQQLGQVVQGHYVSCCRAKELNGL